MEIHNQYKNQRVVNDCLFTDYICLIRLDYHLYLVTYTEAVSDGWTNTPITSTTATFDEYPDALKYMDSLVEKLQ